MNSNVRQILLIEDRADVRLILQENLEHSGFQVWQAANGQQGIELLREGVRPDVIVSDMLMPIKSGEDVLAQIRKNYPGIAFVAMTGSGGQKGKTLKEYALELGADAVLEKPFNIEDLENTILSLLHFS